MKKHHLDALAASFGAWFARQTHGLTAHEKLELAQRLTGDLQAAAPTECSRSGLGISLDVDSYTPEGENEYEPTGASLHLKPGSGYIVIGFGNPGADLDDISVEELANIHIEHRPGGWDITVYPPNFDDCRLRVGIGEDGTIQHDDLT